MQSFDLVAHLYRQRAFSRATFGPGARTKGVTDHIRKELVEIEKAPDDIEEWVDVILLALDGAWRCLDSQNLPIEMLARRIAQKQDKNERRKWPDWRSADPDKAIEYVAMPTERDGCPFAVCPSPYVCKGGCKFGAPSAAVVVNTQGSSESPATPDLVRLPGARLVRASEPDRGYLPSHEVQS